jgi:CBS domain containing-hemolysin-like protein
MTAWNVTELVFVALLIGVVAVMAATETAITKTGRARAYRLVEEERRGARSLQRIIEDLPPYLGVVLLLTLLATIGGTTLAASFAVSVFGKYGEVIATVAMTLITFVVAEVTPKTYAIQHTDRVALRVAPLLLVLGRVFVPVTKVLIRVSNVITPGKGIPEGPFVTEEEIRAMADVASDESAIEEEEKELIHSIFEFGDTLVREVMVPRPDMAAAPVTASTNQVLDLILRRGYSRIPVYGASIDEIEGVVYAKDLLRHLHAGKGDVPLDKIMRTAFFVPETKKVSDLLREMQKRQIHIAIVLDEYGSTAGLITIEDLLEEIVGEIADEYDREEPEMVRLADDSYRVDGRMSVDDLNDMLDAELPNEEWDTVAGLMYGLLGAVPTQGEQISYEDFTFTAERVQGRRIAKILISRRRAPREQEPDEQGAASARDEDRAIPS